MTDVPTRIRLALDRGTAAVPPPPAVHEPTARRVYSDLGLPELFAHAAAAGGMAASLVHLEDLPAELAAYLGRHGVARAAVADTPLLRKIRLVAALAGLGVGVLPAADDALVTSCDAAVAETGSLAFRGGVPAGWATARVRVVILEPKNLVPDLIDFVAAGSGSDVTLVSGPAAVRVFLLH